MTDCEGDDDPAGADPVDGKGAWVAESLGRRLVDAMRDRLALDVERAGSVVRTVAETVVHPSRMGQALAAMRSIVGSFGFDSHSPLKREAAFVRARRLAGLRWASRSSAMRADSSEGSTPTGRACRISTGSSSCCATSSPCSCGLP